MEIDILTAIFLSTGLREEDFIASGVREHGRCSKTGCRLPRVGKLKLVAGICVLY